MTKIRIVEVKSEIAAGTRGASLGIDALKTACLNKAYQHGIGEDQTFFAKHERIEVPNANHNFQKIVILQVLRCEKLILFFTYDNFYELFFIFDF